MKLCIVTNYIGKGYVNELLILDRLIKTLDLKPQDIYSISDTNKSYEVNKKYTHTLLLLDFSISTTLSITPFLDNIKIPKIFVIDSIPEVYKVLDKQVLELKNSLSPSSFISLPKPLQNGIYETYSDGFVFYSKLDLSHFEYYYDLKKPKPIIIIPPSLGKKTDIKLNLSNFNPNKNIGFNGVPSYENGIHIVANSLLNLPEYSLEIYGKHGRSIAHTTELVNNILNLDSNINFKGQLKNPDKFYKNNHIYSSISVYNSFDVFALDNLINGVIPVISNSTPLSEHFEL